MSARPRELRGGLMVCGTASNAGKSTLVAGLCRVLARRGVRVAPFKAQNMALNSTVTASGHEIGRAQAAQAFAAGVEPEVAMNPVLLKPTGDRASQVVVLGRPVAEMTAVEYHEHKPALLDVVLDALADLRTRFDVVLCEGAGSPTEINLLDRDIVNLRVAHETGMPAIVVGDIDLGGVFASLFGTVALLPDRYRRLVRGFVVNKLRGDPALLLDGCAQLHERTGVPTLGVVPWMDGVGLDAEDSIALRDHPGGGPVMPALGADGLDVAVVALPRISNFTDLDPLVCEPGVEVRFVADVGAFGRPDLVILPGTKATVADLGWLRDRGLDAALRRTAATVLGICGGYQMLGRVIDDDVESAAGAVDGLGMLPVVTRFGAEKVTERRHGAALGQRVEGYRIHHGRVRAEAGETFVEIDRTGTAATEIDGVRAGAVYGTTLHGLFENDGFRRAFLEGVAARTGARFVTSKWSFAAARRERVDRLADLLEQHLELEAIEALIASATPVSGTATR